MVASQNRVDGVIRQAEGYLELGLPQQAVEVLQRREALVRESGRASYLLGESLRETERHVEAIAPLKQAAKLLPADMHARLALAWCYKRTDHLDLAIDALEQAVKHSPGEAILHYNLACYWSLTDEHRRALGSLGHAITIDENYLDLVPYETDFDAIRDDIEFQVLTSVIV